MQRQRPLFVITRLLKLDLHLSHVGRATSEQRLVARVVRLVDQRIDPCQDIAFFHLLIEFGIQFDDGAGYERADGDLQFRLDRAGRIHHRPDISPDDVFRPPIDFVAMRQVLLNGEIDAKPQSIQNQDHCQPFEKCPHAESKTTATRYSRQLVAPSPQPCGERAGMRGFFLYGHLHNQLATPRTRDRHGGSRQTDIVNFRSSIVTSTSQTSESVSKYQDCEQFTWR